MGVTGEYARVKPRHGTCVVCKSPILKDSLSKHYCGESCRKKAMNMRNDLWKNGKIDLHRSDGNNRSRCPYCLKEINHQRSTKVFCSDNHRALFHYHIKKYK